MGSTLRLSLIVIFTILLFSQSDFTLAQKSTAVSAPTATSTALHTESIESLQRRLEELIKIVAILKLELTKKNQAALNPVPSQPVFLRPLSLGSEGADVRALQEYLRQFPDLYPDGRVTGYFGPLTQRAIQKLQERYNIVSSGSPGTTGFGVAGPRTISLLNSLITHNNNATKPINLPNGQSEDSMFGLPQKSVVGSPQTVDTERSSRRSGGGGSSNNNNNDEEEEEEDTDTTAPVISAVTITGVTTTLATTTWTTDENSNSKVTVASSSDIFNSPRLVFTSDSLVTSHSVPLTGLSASTTYYFLVTSTDVSGNTATSSQSSFTTATTSSSSPSLVISSVNLGAVSTSSATITWTTNLAAESQVRYATTSGNASTSGLLTSSSSLVTSHSIPLTGLTPDETYYYIVISTADGLTSTSSEYSFDTDSLDGVAMQVTTNGSNQLWSAIDWPYVVYEDQRNGNTDIYLYNLASSTETRITSSGANEVKPKISGDRVVFYNDTDNDVYLYDISDATTNTIGNTSGRQVSPAISGDYVTYVERVGGVDVVMLYEIGSLSSPVQISTSTHAVRPNIDGDYVVWGSDIGSVPAVEYHRISSSTTTHLSLTSEKWYPNVRNGIISYSGRPCCGGGPDWDMYAYYIASSTTKLLTQSFEDSQALSTVTGSNYIIWSGERTESDIYKYDLDTDIETNLTSISSQQIHPASDDQDYVTWTSNQNGSSNQDIYVIEL